MSTLAQIRTTITGYTKFEHSGDLDPAGSGTKVIDSFTLDHDGKIIDLWITAAEMDGDQVESVTIEMWDESDKLESADVSYGGFGQDSLAEIVAKKVEFWQMEIESGNY